MGISSLYLVVSGIIFGIVAAAHLVRAINGWSFVLGPVTISMAASWIAFVFLAGMCVWAIFLLTRSGVAS